MCAHVAAECCVFGGAQDDVDVFRSSANMQPGGFYVGNTTGWMTGAAQSEFLRRVSMRGCVTCRMVLLMCADLLCLGTESTSRSRRTTTCRSGERSMRASCLCNVAHSQPCALARDSVHQDQYREDDSHMLRHHRALYAELRGECVRLGRAGMRWPYVLTAALCVCFACAVLGVPQLDH